MDGRPGLAGPGAVPGRLDWVKVRAEGWRAVLGRCAVGSLMSWVPELRRMCGLSRGDSGDAIVSECMGVSMLLGGYWEKARAAAGRMGYWGSECCIFAVARRGRIPGEREGDPVPGRPRNASPKVTHARWLRSKAAFVLLLVEERVNGAEGALAAKAHTGEAGRS